ncbi:unnamed protein product [Lepeophtheirus salmonis]|uniref:(salmon louse) hypothetical protein n=1 Tax=Lepeophtheirus salmonis TaxID=72036 RepID=A0A7R8CWK3_LEPSM|nr:unnamed protein product [Lepeophtheirus salmonis]CAF2953740.1 unnamed protein product [Lepeophtheirus salmonis]
MRLNTDEIIEILDRLDSNNDIIMGFPDVNDLSDGDSDKSDEEAIGDSDRLSRLLLQAPAHIEQDEDVDEMEENIPSVSKKAYTKTELKVFIGGLLLFVTCPLPNKRKYWSSEDNAPKLLANSMRRDRFIDILHNIHFHDNTLETNDRAIDACVSDNTTNIKKAIQIIGWPLLFCLAHTMNLIVSKGLAEIKSTIDKVKLIVEYVRRSTVALDKLKVTQKQMGLSESRLMQDYPTRSNGTFYML